MLPTITIYGKTITMYGLMIVIGIFIGLVIAVQRRSKYNIKKDDVIFSSCYAGIGLIVGAKLVYIITIIPDLTRHWDKIMEKPQILIGIISGGFVFYGGLIGALIGYYIYAKQFKVNSINLVALITPSIPIIHGFGRIGCFFAGCCDGSNYQGPFHIVFKKSPAAPNGVPLFPIQLLEAGFNIIAGVLIIIYARKERRSGQIVGLYLMYYSIARFIFEFFRGDLAREFS